MGEATLDFISQFRLDYGILGISGIDMDGSLLEFDYHEVCVPNAQLSKPALRDVGDRPFQPGRNAMVNLAMNLIDYLFTDQLPPPSVMKIIEQYDVQLELC